MGKHQIAFVFTAGLTFVAIMNSRPRIGVKNNTRSKPLA
jgi:hypothetical protein